MYDLFRKINKIVEQLKENIHLIMFFNAYNNVKTAKIYQSYSSDDSKPTKESCEKEIQTELHPVPANIDKNYVWNLWELRRKAIELVKRTNNQRTIIRIRFFRQI